VSLANFGIIPYGHSLIGRIYYDPENADGCQPFGEFDYSHDPDDNDHPTPIILVKRGNCTFVKKVRHIEHAGGRLGIVIDDKKENVENVIMSDDGTGMGINIPSLLVSSTDGKILTDFLEEHGGTHYMKKKKEEKKPKDDDDDDDDYEDDRRSRKENKKKEDKKDNKKSEDQKLVEQAALLVKFELPRPDNRVEYDIWYSSIDDRALDFITDFQTYDEMLSEDVLMTPHFVTWPCSDCDEDFKKKECFGDGKYCAIMHKSVSLPGKEIILEDLRQKCIYEKTYKNDRSIFWSYIKRAHICPKYINSECSMNAHTDIGLDYEETMKCVNETFSSGRTDDHLSENKYLASERKNWNEYGVHFYPSIVINTRTYRGSFEPEAVFNSL